MSISEQIEVEIEQKDFATLEILLYKWDNE